jgi:hypothetical protein
MLRSVGYILFPFIPVLLGILWIIYHMKYGVADARMCLGIFL